MNFQDYVTVDNDLETAAQTSADRMTTDQNEAESDGDDETPEPSNHEMIEALQTLSNYAATNDVSELFLESLHYMKSNYFEKKRARRQTAITDFFAKR